VTPEGGDVSVTLKAEAAGFAVEIRDSGEGIADVTVHPGC
jgi:signal transduction histidine kinase